MVERQVLGVIVITTVLAAITIADVDARTFHRRLATVATDMNVVTQAEGKASAVLLRALEPVRNVEGRTQGPGLLCRAMEIDRQLNGHDLTSTGFYIASDGFTVSAKIVKRPRIGVDYARHWAKRLLRFYVKDNPYISKK